MNYKFIWRIHSWVGLYAGVVIAFLSISGAAALFRFEIDEVLNSKLINVQKCRQKISLDSVVRTISSVHPDKELFEIALPKQENKSWNFRFLPKQKSKLFPVLWEVFVNPYNGEVLGERNYYKTFSYYLRNLHVRFYEGLFGRQVVGLAGLALLVSTITGFLMYGKFMNKQSLGSVRTKGLRIRYADYHKFIGIAALVFNLMISITGAWLGLQVYLQKLLSIERPNQFERVEKPLDGSSDANLEFCYDSIYTLARHHFPTLIPLSIRPSTNGERIVTVLGDVPGQTYERLSNKIVFDKTAYQPLFQYNISSDDFGGKLFFVQESFHFGDFAGIWLKICYCLLALTSGFLSLSGFIVYMKRTEKFKLRRMKFVDVRVVLARYVGGIFGFCLVLCFLSVNWGIGVPSLAVISAFYGLLLYLIIKAIILVLKNKISSGATLKK